MIGLSGLLTIHTALLIALTAGSPAALVAGGVTSFLVVLTVLVRRLDRLRWREETWIWTPLERLFRDLDLMPYVPSEVIASGRHTPSGTVRVAVYPNPYPDVSNKVVEERSFAR